VLDDRRKLEQPTPPDAFARCGREWTCYFLTHSPGAVPAGKWVPVFESKGAIRESLNGYRLLADQ
jgi:hypothetical protein